MDTALLSTKFDRIGARLKFADRPSRRTRADAAVSLDVRTDRRGEFFEVTLRPNATPEIEPLDVRPADRHLLLLVREGRSKSKFLCGHDERHWFVAAVPEAASVGTVAQAMEALKPAEVRETQARLGLRAGERNRRRNAAFVRQGEWFFLPVVDFAVDGSRVRHWEPLRRGGGSKPHMAEWCYRTGGETVYVCDRHPNGLLEAQQRQVIRANPEARQWNWRVMMRNAAVYVRGRVRHADHATIELPCWHRVVMNTEGQALAMRNVAFLD
jgi:hypothetical protein